MRKFDMLLAGLCVLGLATGSAVPARAEAPQSLAGTLSGSYGRVSISGGGGNADVWGFDGQAAFGLGMPEFGAEIDGGFHQLSGSGANFDTYNIGGNAFWAPAQGRFGGTVQYQSSSSSGIDIHITGYGAFGEFFASDNFTLGLNGGGWNGSVAGISSDGSFVGGGGSFYAMPDLAITGLINYFSDGSTNLTNYTAMAEWLFSETTPLSVFGSYTNTQISGGGGSLDQWLIGVKFYTDGNGASLVAKHRNGALDSLTKPSLRIFN